MISKLINGFVSVVSNTIKSYGIPLESQYNSDLDMITEYSKSMKLRTIFSNNTDLTLLDDTQIAELSNTSYNLMMYKYSPLKRDDNRFNNIDIELVFNSNKLEPMSKLNFEGVDENWRFLYNKFRKLNDDNKDGLVRDVIFGSIDITFKILSSSTDQINDMQMIYLQKLQRVVSLPIELDLGSDIGVHTFKYSVEFDDISDIGHIDRKSYGNLQQITFSGKISGPIFSSYIKKVPFLEKIDVIVNLD